MASLFDEAGSSIEGQSQAVYSPNYTSDHSHINSLDVLKGIAVLLALFVSIYAWGGFSEGMQSKLIGNPKGWHYRVYALISLLLEGKMRALISLTFGAGMILFLVRPHPGSNISSSELLVRRNMWMMLFGLFNAFVFLWPQDILFHLGIMGLLLFPFPRMSTRGLMIAVIIIVLIGSAKNYWYYKDDQKAYNKYLVVQALEKKFSKDSAARMNTKDSVLFKKRLAGSLGVADSLANKKIADSLAKKAGDTLTRKQNDEKKSWEGIAKKYTYEAKNDSTNIKAIQKTTYSKLWDHLLPQIKSRESRWFYKNGVWEFAAIMLLGMFLFKKGFFNGQFSQKQYLKMVLIGIGLGLICGWYRLYFHNASILDYTKYVQTRSISHTILWPFERAFMALGIASGVVWFCESNMLKRLSRILSDVGKLALTNYLLQSVFLSIFFYGYGMGYYARMGQFMLYFLVAEVCLSQVVFSVLWLRYFYSGPAEWLLRSLMYKKKIPFRRKEDETPMAQEQSVHSAI
jgi:uncharacterized protein